MGVAKVERGCSCLQVGSYSRPTPTAPRLTPIFWLSSRRGLRAPVGTNIAHRTEGRKTEDQGKKQVINRSSLRPLSFFKLLAVDGREVRTATSQFTLV
ncbi:hypothetical protein K1719_024349 [Acacia pycnantha]|nr:hypothetical protein K1719_024349 [Acacia pycnantha]